jgi:hypothetical protein
MQLYPMLDVLILLALWLLVIAVVGLLAPPLIKE